MAHEIKRRTVAEVGLTCSVGVGYSMMSAKLASEEMKPDGFFKIPDAAALVALIAPRGVRTIFGVGAKTAAQLEKVGITTVKHVLENAPVVAGMFGKQGPQIVNLAKGIDPRKVTSSVEQKSIGTEQTFQKDITDFSYLEDVLLLIARKLSFDVQTKGLYASTITVKAIYANANMQIVTRSKTGEPTNKTREIHRIALELLHKIERRAIRLIGITLSGFTDTPAAQLTLFDTPEDDKDDKVNEAMLKLQLKYGQNIVKTVGELSAERKYTSDYAE